MSKLQYVEEEVANVIHHFPSQRQEMEALMAEKRGANIAKADLEAQVRKRK